jgi:hypothetical protein
MQGDQSIQTAWLRALEERHLANLTRQEFTRAVRALSARYVERRGQLPDRSPLDSAGKRAAFGLFYAPLHFVTTRLVIAGSQDRDAAPIRRDLSTLVDLGCGTGVCSAAWALTHEQPPAITGVDASAWAIEEARWNWRALGLRGRAVRGDLFGTASSLLRQPDATLAGTGIIAGWALNELVKAERERLLDVIDSLVDRGVTLVILEPLARGVTPWWEEWTARLARHGVRDYDFKADVDLPAPLDSFSDAAGFRKKEIGARVMHARRASIESSRTSGN